MEIRDAVEADAERLAEMTDAPTDVMRNLVHDRTVRVAGESDVVEAFVSYDAQESTVHVTQLEGDPELCGRLLSEPTRFAEREGMAVELLVPDDEEAIEKVIRDASFVAEGTGPAFDGTPTRRYRWEPDDAET